MFREQLPHGRRQSIYIKQAYITLCDRLTGQWFYEEALANSILAVKHAELNYREWQCGALPNIFVEGIILAL